MINTQIPAQLAADLSENQVEALAAWAKKHTQQAFILGAQKGFDFGLNMDADGFEAMLAAPAAYQEQSVRGILTDAHIETLAKQYDCHNASGFKGFARAVIEAQASGQTSGYPRQLNSEKSDGWKMEMDDSDRYINELCQQYGYVHPLAIAARLEQWISRHGGEDAGTLVMGEAMRALRKANDLIRIDVCLPNGMPDSECITHDECRKRLAAFGDSHRQLMELKRIFSAVENAGPTS